MTNLSKKNNIKQVKEVVKKVASLDKLAQLSFSAQKTTKKTLFKRAKSKHFTNVYVKKLASLKSPLQKSYNNTIYGCSEILVQKGNKLTSTYCNNRWCTTCNRIRTAKQIKGYTKPLNNLIEPMFVTLTIPNVKNDILKGTLKEMLRQFTNIRKNLHSKKIKLVGLRKLECTYNPIRHDYHPHFHLIIQGKKDAETLVCEWLKRFPSANSKGQDIRPANEGSILELFKYFTKIITKRSIYITPLDVIFQSIRGMRVFQPFGIKKVSEDIDELVSQEIKDITENDTLWRWFESDWVDNQTGELLTGYEIDEGIKSIIDNII